MYTFLEFQKKKFPPTAFIIKIEAIMTENRAKINQKREIKKQVVYFLFLCETSVSYGEWRTANVIIIFNQ